MVHCPSRRRSHRLARWASVFAALAALLSFSAAADAPVSDDPVAAAPRIEVLEQSIDAGTVVQGDRVEAVFEIRNTGGAQLAILSAKPS